MTRERSIFRSANMQMLKQTSAVLLALFVCLAIFVWIESFSSSFQSCINEQASRGIVVSYTRCTARFVNEHDGGITALATIIIAAFTGTIWSINRSQLAHGRKVERAYISGGFGSTDRDSGAIFPGFNNDGKTPCVVNYIAVDVKPLANLPKKPVYPERKFVNYQIPPNHRLVALHVWTFSKRDKDEIFYGRFWYADIFGDEHTSGFALHLGREGMPALEGFPEYWKWT